MVYPRGGLKVLQLQRYNMHASSVKHRYNLCFHITRQLCINTHLCASANIVFMTAGGTCCPGTVL